MLTIDPNDRTKMSFVWSTRTWFVVVLLWVACSCESKVNPKVKCTRDIMRVEIPHSENVELVYLDGLRDYPDEQCKTKLDGGVHVFELNLRDVHQCGVTRMLNQITGVRVYTHRVIIETKDDEVKREIVQVRCQNGANLTYNHTLTKRNVLPVGFQEPEDLEITTTLLERAPQPVLGVNVRQGGVPLSGGQLHVAPGTPLQMEIFLDKTSAPIYGLLVTHMQVTDTGNQEETIIFNGCSVDPYLFDNFITEDGDFLTAKFRAFKFPESTYVQFRGTVNVCLDKCRGVECSNGVTGFGRRKREISALPPDPNKIFEITITSFIKVNYEDESENFEDLIKNQMNKHKKLITGITSEDKPIQNSLKETSVSAKQLNLGREHEEVQYTAIIQETNYNTATSTSLNGLLLTAALYLVRYVQ